MSDYAPASVPSPAARRIAVEWPFSAEYVQRLLNLCGSETVAMDYLRQYPTHGLDPLQFAAICEPLKRGFQRLTV